MIEKKDLEHLCFKTEQVKTKRLLSTKDNTKNKTASIFRECYTTITTLSETC